MITKKAQVSKVFVFATSLIIIGFVVLLAGKFIGSFSGDVETKIDVDFLRDIGEDYTKTLKSYSSEREGKYQLTNNVNLICFMPKSGVSSETCVSEVESSIQTNVTNYDEKSLWTMVNNGDNVILFSKNDVLYQKHLGDYKVDKCFCIKPNRGIIKLFFQNIKHEVHIMDLNEFN